MPRKHSTDTLIEALGNSLDAGVPVVVELDQEGASLAEVLLTHACCTTLAVRLFFLFDVATPDLAPLVIEGAVGAILPDAAPHLSQAAVVSVTQQYQTWCGLMDATVVRLAQQGEMSPLMWTAEVVRTVLPNLLPDNLRKIPADRFARSFLKAGMLVVQESSERCTALRGGVALVEPEPGPEPGPAAG
jgi:hypothetical protein